MTLVTTQLLTEMSTRNISWGVKGAVAEVRQPYHLPVPIVMKPGSLNLLEPSGPLQARTGIAVAFLSCLVTRVKYKYAILKWKICTTTDASFSMKSNLKRFEKKIR